MQGKIWKIDQLHFKDETSLKDLAPGLVAQLVRALYNNIMGSWRNRLAQESYTFKVNGSSPLLPTKYNKYDYRNIRVLQK